MDPCTLHSQFKMFLWHVQPCRNTMFTKIPNKLNPNHSFTPWLDSDCAGSFRCTKSRATTGGKRSKRNQPEPESSTSHSCLLKSYRMYGCYRDRYVSKSLEMFKQIKKDIGNVGLPMFESCDRSRSSESTRGGLQCLAFVCCDSI